MITSSAVVPSGMQLGPDGKIYVARGTNSIAVINAPNSSGTMCNYTAGAVTIPGASNIISFPSFIAGYNYNNTSQSCPPLTTDISENYNSTLLISPNPFSSNVTIKLGSEFKNITSLNFYDVQGKLIYHLKNISDEFVKIDLSAFEKGIYILNVVSTKDSKNYKIVKQ
ncbi:hypothetical protein BH10BAC1_BH10BAC1_12330 [soil metagenome]